MSNNIPENDNNLPPLLIPFVFISMILAIGVSIAVFYLCLFILGFQTHNYNCLMTQGSLCFILAFSCIFPSFALTAWIWNIRRFHHHLRFSTTFIWPLGYALFDIILALIFTIIPGHDAQYTILYYILLVLPSTSFFFYLFYRHLQKELSEKCHWILSGLYGFCLISIAIQCSLAFMPYGLFVLAFGWLFYCFLAAGVFQR